MATKKLTLKSDTQSEITLIGVSTTLPDYRLIHHINKQLGAAFSKQPDLPYYLSDDETLLLPLYHHLHAQSRNNWFMLANGASTAKKVVPSLKNIDFFLLIDDVAGQDALEEILNPLRRVRSVQMATVINPAAVKNMELLYADLEMHLMEINKEKKARETTWCRDMPPTE